jgi:hypothetical protein
VGFEMGGQPSRFLLKRRFFVQIFAVEQDGGYQYRSVIFLHRPIVGSPVCEKWHGGEPEMVQILNSALHDTVDAKEILSKAQSIEGWMMEFELTDPEATLLGWKPEISGD